MKYFLSLIGEKTGKQHALVDIEGDKFRLHENLIYSGNQQAH